MKLVFDLGTRCFQTLFLRKDEEPVAECFFVPFNECLEPDSDSYLKNLHKFLPGVLKKLRFNEFQISALLSPSFFNIGLFSGKAEKGCFIYDNPGHPQKVKLKVCPQAKLLENFNQLLSGFNIEATFLGCSLNAELDAALSLLCKSPFRHRTKEISLLLSVGHHSAHLFFLQKDCVLHYCTNNNCGSLQMDLEFLQNNPSKITAIDSFRESELILLPAFKRQTQSIVPAFCHCQHFFNNLINWLSESINSFQKEYPQFQPAELFYCGGLSALRNFDIYLSGALNMSVLSLIEAVFADTEKVDHISPSALFSSVICHGWKEKL